MSEKSDLPFGSEFSPSQIDLPELLKLVMQHSGNFKTLQDAIENRFFSQHGRGNAKNRRTLAMNCRLGMKAYGIVDENAALTEFGRDLLEICNDNQSLYDAFARHILLNLKGMSLVQCIRDMTVAGEVVNLTSLRAALAERGIHYPPGGKHPSMMRLWLEKAGVFARGHWRIDEARLEEVSGAKSDDFEKLAHFTPEQRAFLLALANTGIKTPQLSNQIARLAEAVYGVRFPEKSLPKLVLNALVDAGYITIEKTTSGRGARPFLVSPTDKIEFDIITPMLEQLKNQTDAKLLDLLKKPLGEIVAEIKSEDRYLAGLALEALAFKLMRFLDMDYVATRLRGQVTGGSEVDLIFQSARLVFSRWQVQCKNTAHISLDDVAKEVGLTHFLKSNVIVMVSSGDIGSEARRYANKIMADSNLCVVMVDGNDLNILMDAPMRIVDIFNREARHAMTLKKLDIQDKPNV